MKKDLTSHYRAGVEARSYLPGLGVFEREVRRFFRVPAQTLGSPLGTSLLYFVVFYFSIGKMLASSAQGQKALSLGISYILFLIPGVIAMEVINASFQNPVSSIMQSKWMGTIVDQLMAPLSAHSMWAAYVSGAMVRAIIVTAATYLAGSLFAQEFTMHNILLLMLAIVLATGIFSSLGIITGVLCKSFDQVGMVGSFILQPLVFLSGVFFSLSSLPPQLAFLPYLNPVFYIVNMFRHSVVGAGDADVLTSFCASAVFFVVLSLLAIGVIRKGIGMRV